MIQSKYGWHLVIRYMYIYYKENVIHEKMNIMF